MATGSGLFSKEAPAQERFVTGKASGKAGEIWDLRKDVERTFRPLASITVEEFTNVAAAGAAVLKAAAATAAEGVVTTYTAADLLAAGKAALASVPRQVSFTTAGTTPANAPANAVVTGTDINGAVMSETITVPQTATISTGAKCFSTITSIVFAASDGADATVSIGIGTAFGLAKPIKSRAGVATAIKEIAAGAVATNGTFAAASAAAPNGSYTPNTAANGTNDYALYYEFDSLV